MSLHGPTGSVQLVLSPHSPPHLKVGGKRGVWGEGAEGPGSPHNYSAKADLWQRGP